MQMNWRLLTAINAAIALVTVIAAIFIVAHHPNEHTRRTARQTSDRSNLTREEQASDREAKARVEALTDLSQARVDDLGSVPAAELTHLMDRATPEQLAALALKFNDAPTDARTMGGMAVFFQAWTELDPKSALSGAFQISDITMRRLAARAVVASVSPSAAPELIAELSEHPDKDLMEESTGELLDTLVGTWSNLDPEAASNFVDSLGDKSNLNQYGTKQKIGYAWGTLDPKAALDWVEKQGDRESYLRIGLLDEVVRGWCLNNIRDASAYVFQHVDEPGVGNAASTIADAMFEKDVDAATHWANSLPPGDARDSAERSIARLWVQKDPSAAAQWLATLPESDQTTVVTTVANNWVNTDWPNASQWLGTLTGNVRDQALSIAADRNNSTPTESLSLAQQIQNEGMRNDSVQQIIRNWAATDAQAAETWVKNSPLNDEQRQKLLSVISETKDAANAERVIVN